MYIAFICNDVYLNNYKESAVLEIPGTHVECVAFKEFAACREYVIARIDDYIVDNDIEHLALGECETFIPADIKDKCVESYGYITLPEEEIKVLGMVLQK